MKKETRKFICGVSVMCISILIVSAIDFLREGMWNWDYISLSGVGLLTYILCGLITKISKNNSEN